MIKDLMVGLSGGYQPGGYQPQGGRYLQKKNDYTVAPRHIQYSNHLWDPFSTSRFFLGGKHRQSNFGHILTTCRGEF